MDIRRIRLRRVREGMVVAPTVWTFDPFMAIPDPGELETSGV
jgi:hypothetical protein